MQSAAGWLAIWSIIVCSITDSVPALLLRTKLLSYYALQPSGRGRVAVRYFTQTTIRPTLLRDFASLPSVEPIALYQVAVAALARSEFQCSGHRGAHPA